jgi:hypothetical protein
MAGRIRHCTRAGVSTEVMRDFFALQGRSYRNSSTKAFFGDSYIRKSLIIRQAGVAELADAPDLGLRNHRFQSVAFRFKANAFYE